MRERKKFSILIPCFNEGKSLGNLLSQIIPLQQEYDLEIILIENGSTDKSIEFFRKIEGYYNNERGRLSKLPGANPIAESDNLVLIDVDDYLGDTGNPKVALKSKS